MYLEIRYANTLEDFAEYSKLADRQSGWVKLMFNWALPIGVFVLTVLSFEDPLPIRIFAGVIGAILVHLVAISPIGRWGSYVVLWLNSKMSRDVIGKRRLIVTEEALIEQTALNRTVVPWNRVGPVYTVATYTIIHIKIVLGAIIPNERILEGELEPFLEEVHKRAKILKLK